MPQFRCRDHPPAFGRHQGLIVGARRQAEGWRPPIGPITAEPGARRVGRPLKNGPGRVGYRSLPSGTCGHRTRTVSGADSSDPRTASAESEVCSPSWGAACAVASHPRPDPLDRFIHDGRPRRRLGDHRCCCRLLVQLPAPPSAWQVTRRKARGWGRRAGAVTSGGPGHLIIIVVAALLVTRVFYGLVPDPPEAGRFGGNLFGWQAEILDLGHSDRIGQEYRCIGRLSGCWMRQPRLRMRTAMEPGRKADLRVIHNHPFCVLCGSHVDLTVERSGMSQSTTRSRARSPERVTRSKRRPAGLGSCAGPAMRATKPGCDKTSDNS